MDNVKWTLTELGNENELLLHGKRMTLRETESKEKEECMSLHCSDHSYCCIPVRTKCAIMKLRENEASHAYHGK